MGKPKDDVGCKPDPLAVIGVMHRKLKTPIVLDGVTVSEITVPILRLELIGRDYRMLMRSVVKEDDPEGWACYRALKDDADTLPKKSVAWMHLVMRFLVLPKKSEALNELVLEVYDIAMRYGPTFPSEGLGALPASERQMRIAQEFISATYTFPGL